MFEPFAPYASAILALGLYGFLYVVQLLIADVVGIRRGHTPGTEIASGHDDFHFRAVRAHANTGESVGAVILISAFAILSGGEPGLVNAATTALLAFRALHMFAYYLDVRLLRSIAFGLFVLSLIVVFLSGLRAFPA